MALELYHNDMSTCAMKVRLVLAEKGLEWEGHHMDLRAGDTRTNNYIENFNPGGVVPTLVDDKMVVYESTVIMEYLDDVFPHPPLRSSDPSKRARMRLWTKQLDEGLHAATGTISTCIAFRYQMIRGRNDAEVNSFINKIPDSVRRERSRDAILKGLGSSNFPTAIIRFEKLWNDIEKILDNHAWLAGDSYSLADAAYTPYITRFEHLQLLRILDSRPRLADWYERIKARPSYDEAMRNWFNQNYLTLMEEKGNEAREQVNKIIAGVT